MKQKLIRMSEALTFIKDGMTVMIGGFMGCGNPLRLIDGIMKTNVKNLTVICNDAAKPDYGVAKLLSGHKIKKLICTHIGMNPEAGRQMNSGECDIELIPQGTFAERIRCGGAGLGGFLTPTGVGTVVEEGKQTFVSEGKTYLLELPLKADLALISAYYADVSGNLYYRGSTRNFGALMATAAETVIAEADIIVENGFIKQEDVHTPGLFVDYVLDGGSYDAK